MREIEVDRRSGAARRAGDDVRRSRDGDPGVDDRRPPSAACRRTTSSISIVTTNEAHSAGRHRERSSSGTGLRVRDRRDASSSGTEDHVRIVAGDGKPAALHQHHAPDRRQHRRDRRQRRADRGERCARRCRRASILKPVYDQASLVRDADEVGARRDAHRRGARRDHPAALPAPRPHHRDQRVVDPDHDGDHRVRHVAASGRRST